MALPRHATPKDLKGLSVLFWQVDGATVADGGRFVWFNSALQKAGSVVSVVCSLKVPKASALCNSSTLH